MANTLIGKIAAASLKVGSLETDKTNTQQNYKYISADKVLERAGDALAKAGVVIVPSITVENTEAVKTDKGGTRYDSVVHFAMIVTDGETQIEMPWIGRGNDYSVPDKALYKAITSGHKYFLMKLLNVGVGNEDGEHETETPEVARKATQPSPKTQAQGDEPKARVNAVQLAEINRLGELAYAAEWDANKDKLAEWASGGARKTIGDLFELEASKLIKALEKKVAA